MERGLSPNGDNGAVTDVRLAVLGGVSLWRDGARVGLGGPQAERVLAVLLANHGRPTSADRLADTLWGERPPASATATIHSHLSRLRTLLGPSIVIARESDAYRIDCPEEALDVVGFEDRLARSRTAPSAAACALLAEALGMWHGRAFGEHADLDHVRAEAARLDELRLVVTDEWAALRLDLGHAAEMVGELEALVLQHPLRERYWLLLMRALHQNGRQVEALRRGQLLREMLAEEAGLEVSEAVRQLEQQILVADPVLLAAAHSPAAGARRSGAAGMLIGTTSFVGRDPEVRDVMAAVGVERVVTVTGPGGVGKTRLALRAAAAVAEHSDRDVTVVELAPLRDASGIVQVIAHALDVQQRQQLTLEATLEEYLASRRVLLVLDNCEHVIDAVAPMVDRLCAACPSLVVLATSRVPLGLPGEHVVAAGPLEVPDHDEITVEDARRSPAVELFVSRAAASVPGFVLDDGNVRAVVQVCRRLDGLPLGIELAAARLRTVGIDTLADRLARRVLSLGAQRGGDGRQRTIEGMVRWSYELLDEATRAVFEQLAVFAGGFDLEAVEAVCDRGDGGRPEYVIDSLATLVDHSMVEVVDLAIPRYRLLEPLREFAADRLAERVPGGGPGSGPADLVSDRHLRWFHDVAARGALGLDSPDEGLWSAQLERDLDNFRAAHRWGCAVGATDLVVGMVAALREQGFRRVQYETTVWAEEACALPGASGHPEISTLLAMVAYRHWVRGDVHAAIRQANAALDAVPGDEPSPSGLAERVLGNAHFYLGHHDAALMWMDRMLASATHAGDEARRVHGLYMRSVVRTSLGDSVRGAVLAGEARAAAERTSSPTALAQADYALGLGLEGTDRHEALEHLEASAARGGAAGNRWIEAFALTEVHWLEARAGDHLVALRGYGEVVRTWYRGGDWANQWLSLRHVFGIFIDLGALREAAVLHGGLTAVGAAHALPFEPGDAERLSSVADELRSLLGPDAFADAVRNGASMTDSELVELTLRHIDALTS